MDTTLRTVTEAAHHLGMTPGAVRDAIAKGKIAAVRVGGGEQRAGLLLITDDQIAAYRRLYRDRRGKYARQRIARGEADNSGDE